MPHGEKVTLLLVRLTLGWMFLYAGISHLIDPKFSASGYISGAKTFSALYLWLATPGPLSVIDFVIPWALLLLGLSLIVGLFVRLSSTLGAILMVLFYFPVLAFPFVSHSFLVDEHIIYAAILLFLAQIRAGQYWGLDAWCRKLPTCSRYPKLMNWLG